MVVKADVISFSHPHIVRLLDDKGKVTLFGARSPFRATQIAQVYGATMIAYHEGTEAGMKVLLGESRKKV